MKRFLLSLVALGALLGIAHAVNITGVDGSDANRVQAVGFLRMSVTDGLTAVPSGTQATSTLLNSAYSRVTTTATNNDSVKLPLCRAGQVSAVGAGQPVYTIGQIMYVTNAGAATLGVFPSVGDSINAGAADAIYAGMTTGKTSAFLCASAGKWYSILGG